MEGGAWMGQWGGVEDEPMVNNYSEDHKLMEGALIKLGDYAHFRYFQLFRNGRFCYYELQIPSQTDGKESPGPRRVHLTLTPEYLRGVMMLTASVNNQEPVKNEDDYDTDLMKRGLMFNRKKLEMQLTGYSPNGELMSWKLRANNDATFVKWERAFRLALRPIWVHNTPSCLVCQKDFTFFFRPHHCRKCGTCMCDECSVLVPRLPMQGYYDAVRICRDCSPIKIQRSELKAGTRVLVYGIYSGRVVQVNATDDSDTANAFVSVQLERKSGEGPLRRFPLEFVELYSEAVQSSNIIKAAIRQHLAHTFFRTQLNFSTWNLLETVQEQKTVQMVKILNKSPSINELHSLIPSFSSYEAPYFPSTDEVENDKVRDSLAHYRGVHVTFPLRLDTVIKLIDQFRNGILLHRFYVYQILEETEKLFRDVHRSPMNSIYVPSDVRFIVVGDLHGQLEDLLTILDKNGIPSYKTRYLFNGDFVDRGQHGVEVMLLLLTFKLLYPEYVYLNRGNHEERMINEMFGFEDEVFAKYNTEGDEAAGWEGLSTSRKYSPTQLFQMFETIFRILPLFALVNDHVFIVHGGLSNLDDVTIEELQEINHLRDIPTQGITREDELFTHLLWSDPRPDNGWKASGRGAGVEFGPDITRKFCEINRLSLIIRSHECQEEGYEIVHDGLMLTVFSASSYCGSQTNKGAYVQLETVGNDDLKPHVVQYYAQPLQKLRDAGKNEWRKKAQRLERRTLISLVELVCEKKNTLLSAFTQIDTRGTGHVTKLQWKQVLQDVLGIKANFLSYYKQLASVEGDGVDGVDYISFLNRYTVQLNTGSVDWKRNLIRKVWMGFSRALSQTSTVDVAKMNLQEKLRAAFDVFQSGPENLQGSFNGNVTYDVFRSTIQGKLGLSETLSEQQIFELMQHMDQDRDGVISYDEFCVFFAEFSRGDYLQELFEVDDANAINLLNRFGTALLVSNKYPSLQNAFSAFTSGNKDRLEAEDLLKASEELEMIPALSESDAKLLYDSILRTYYGVNMRKAWDKRGLDWVVFEDVFSPDSTFQRQLWMTSLKASHSNLSSQSLKSLSENVANEEENNDTRNRTPRNRQAWADTLVGSVKQSLHEQRLYIKLLFRTLDRKRVGYISKEKFIAAMNAINEEHGSPLRNAQLEQLADAFVHRKTVKKVSDSGEEEEVVQTYVEYPLFLQSLRVMNYDDDEPVKK